MSGLWKRAETVELFRRRVLVCGSGKLKPVFEGPNAGNRGEKEAKEEKEEKANRKSSLSSEFSALAFDCYTRVSYS